MTLKLATTITACSGWSRLGTEEACWQCRLPTSARPVHTQKLRTSPTCNIEFRNALTGQVLHCRCNASADEKPVQITVARRSGRGSGARLRCVCFVFLGRSVFFGLQINPFRPSPSHPATESQCFRFSVNNFSQSSLVGKRRGGGRKMFFIARSRRPCVNA